MKKAIVILTALAFFLLPFTISAAIIPEDNLIGETVYIEPDENFIKDNIKKGDPFDTSPDETAREISLDRDTYAKKTVLPFVCLTCFGITVYGIGSAISASKRKKQD